MALVLADRVEQVTRTTGLGDLTLGETLRGRQSFQSVTNNGDTVIYVLEDAEGVEWEIGTGTVVHGTDTVLQRTTIRQSSNSDAKISLSAGTHRVFLAADAQFFSSIVTSDAITAAIAAHEAELDPHPQYTTTAEAAAAAPVQSVNGETGTVLLDAADVGATPSSHVGTGGAQHANATTTVAGFMSGADKAKLDGVEANAKDDQSAAEVPYDNGTSGLTATDVQAAIDEVDSDLDAYKANLASNAAGSGSDDVAHTGTPDTVTEALNKRALVSDVKARSLYLSDVSALLAIPIADLTDGQAVIVNERISGVPASGGIFKWDAVSTATDDGDFVLQIAGEPTGRWLRTSNSTLVNPLDRKVIGGLPPTGEITLPVTFNNTLNSIIYFDGTKAQYYVSPYDQIDFEKWEPVTQYYVNYDLGTDAGAGTSTGAGAWKTFDYALANAVSPAVINLEDDIVGYLSAQESSNSFTGKLKIKGKEGRTIIAAMRESYDLASFSWASSGASNAYVSSTASANFYRAQFDGKYRDVNGIPRPIVGAGSIAACQTTPGTYFWDAGTTSLYVHMHDGRIPDPADGWLYAESPYKTELQQGGDTAEDIILIENVEFLSNTGTAPNDGFRYRPVTVGSETAARLGLKNCLSYGCSANAFEVYDADVLAMEDCHGAYTGRDGLNYHSFVSTGTNGEYMTVYEHNCSAKQAGYSGFADQPALGTSNNGSTAHDSLQIIRTNGVFYDTVGAVVADVNGVHSLNYNVSAGNPLGLGSPKACFWHEKFLGAGTTKEMYLWGCSAWDKGEADVFVISTEAQSGGSVNDGDITVEYWRGQKDGKITGTIS